MFSSRRMNLITDLFFLLPALPESSCGDYCIIAGTRDRGFCSWAVWRALLIAWLYPIFKYLGLRYKVWVLPLPIMFIFSILFTLANIFVLIFFNVKKTNRHFDYLASAHAVAAMMHNVGGITLQGLFSVTGSRIGKQQDWGWIEPNIERSLRRSRSAAHATFDKSKDPPFATRMTQSTQPRLLERLCHNILQSPWIKQPKTQSP